MKHPEVFGGIATLSTSAWWDNRFIVRFERDDLRCVEAEGAPQDETACANRSLGL